MSCGPAVLAAGQDGSVGPADLGGFCGSACAALLAPFQRGCMRQVSLSL